VTNALYDFWAPGQAYMAYHAGIRILSEAASASLASPLTVRRTKFRLPAWATTRVNEAGIIWSRGEGGTWRIGDIVDYQLIAFESLLYQPRSGARICCEILRSGRRAVGRTSPYAFCGSRAQMDPGVGPKMLELLAFGDVEIKRGERCVRRGRKALRRRKLHRLYAAALQQLRQDAAGAPAIIPTCECIRVVRRSGLTT